MREKKENKKEYSMYMMQRANTLLLLGSIFFLAGITILVSTSNEIFYMSLSLLTKDSGWGLFLVGGILLLIAGVKNFFLAEKFRNIHLPSRIHWIYNNYVILFLLALLLIFLFLKMPAFLFWADLTFLIFILGAYFSNKENIRGNKGNEKKNQDIFHTKK